MDLAVVIPVAVFVVLISLFIGVKLWFMRRHDDDERRRE